MDLKKRMYKIRIIKLVALATVIMTSAALIYFIWEHQGASFSPNDCLILLSLAVFALCGLLGINNSERKLYYLKNDMDYKI